MNCPYCAEEIKDAAIVCRYCQRDLAFFQHFMGRIETLEKSLRDVQAALEKSVTELQQAIKAGLPAVPRGVGMEVRPVVKKPILKVLLLSTAIVGIVEFCLFWAANMNVPPTAAWFGISGLCIPFLWLLYLAVSNRYERIIDYVWFGVTQGMATGLALALSPRKWGGAFRFDETVVAILIGSGVYGLVFLTVGLFRRLFNRRKRGFTPTDLAAKVAFTVIGSPETVTPGSATATRWKKVSDLIAAFAPILTLIGTIIVAYFGYLAAVAKATGVK